jgi:predicted RNase H-like HicB family nuclease
VGKISWPRISTDQRGSEWATQFTFSVPYNIPMDMTLTAVFEEVPASDGGGFVAYAEELPGAISEGETLDEARENLRDAIAILLDANRELAGKRSRGAKITREKIRVSVA